MADFVGQGDPTATALRGASIAGGVASSVDGDVAGHIDQAVGIAGDLHQAGASILQVAGATTVGGTPQMAVKATLEIEGGGAIPFQFNPAQLAINKSVTWVPNDAKGRNAPNLRFQSGQPASLQLSMTLDDVVGNPGTPLAVSTKWMSDQSVLGLTELLLKLVKVDKKLPVYDRSKASGRPPWVRLRWGKTRTLNVKFVVESVKVQYTLFARDGTPLRAKVDLSLKQFSDDAEPATSASPSGAKPGSLTGAIRSEGIPAAGDAKGALTQRDWRKNAPADLRLPVGGPSPSGPAQSDIQRGIAEHLASRPPLKVDYETGEYIPAGSPRAGKPADELYSDVHHPDLSAGPERSTQ